MTRITVASLNIRGVPLTGSELVARCRAIGESFEACDADVVCFQEVHTYYHLALLARRMRSFRYISFRRSLVGPAGDVATFSRLPVVSTMYRGFGVPPSAPGIPALIRLKAGLKGILVTRLARPGVSVINTHPLANTDGDWSRANRFYPVHRAQLASLARLIVAAPPPVTVSGDFNIARDSDLFEEFMRATTLDDAFEGACPATYRAEYLPPGATPHCIDFILTGGEIKAESAGVLFAGKQALGPSAGYVSDHLGLRAQLHLPAA